jgi:protein-tyrosine phosphatase
MFRTDYLNRLQWLLFQVFNLSKRRHDLLKFNPFVLEYGWPEDLAPPLERLCSICKEMDAWLTSNSQNVVVLHSKGGRGRAGVVVAAYLHYTNICARFVSFIWLVRLRFRRSGQEKRDLKRQWSFRTLFFAYQQSQAISLQIVGHYWRPNYLIKREMKAEPTLIYRSSDV